ncbi:MAG: cytidylate kinase-like family protein, partial [Clostridia bacterium]
MKKCVITIGRQFGSGGGEIARKTAEKLQITCLDKELIEKSAEKSGISREAFESVDERATNSFLYSLAMSSYGGQLSAVGNTDIVLSDRLFSVQSEIIRKAAQESSCIIIGRCADDILSKTEKILRVFIYAPLDVRV